MSDRSILLYDGNRCYLGYYFIYRSLNYKTDSISPAVLGFKDNKEADIQLWTNKIPELAEDFPKVDVIVRAGGHDEKGAISDVNKPLDKLARSLAGALGPVAVYQPDALEKNRETKSMNECKNSMTGCSDDDERRREVAGVYSVNSCKIPEFESTPAFLVVDDVRTSGATTDEISRAIKDVYPESSIYIFALVDARARGLTEEARMQHNKRLFSYLQGRKE